MVNMSSGYARISSYEQKLHGYDIISDMLYVTRSLIGHLGRCIDVLNTIENILRRIIKYILRLRIL